MVNYFKNNFIFHLIAGDLNIFSLWVLNTATFYVLTLIQKLTKYHKNYISKEQER